jgi:putative transposase
MPRRARVVIPGVAHHITQRGNDRQPVFLCPADWTRYLDLLGRHASRWGAQILAYCLMPNHVHLVAVPERGDSLARTLGRTHSEYALARNRAGGRSGHLWQGRFFSCPLDASHALRAVRYVELNPVRAGLARAAWEWPWSSGRAHAMDKVPDKVLDYRWAEYFGGWNYGEWKEILTVGAPDGEVAAVRRATSTGEPLGSTEFIMGLERQAGRRLRVWERGRPRQKPQSGEEAVRQACLFAVGGR